MPTRRTVGRSATLWAAAAAAVVVALLGHSGSYTVLTPGPALPADMLLVAPATDPGAASREADARDSSVLFPTVAARPGNRFDAWWCHLRAACSATPVASAASPTDGATGGATGGAPGQTQADALEAAVQNARTLAVYLAHTTDHLRPHQAPATTSRSSEQPGAVTYGYRGLRLGGPSAGLALTLTALDDLTTGDLTSGHRVAATGTITPDGRVHPVGAVALKVPGVLAAHADVLFVPAGQDRDLPAHRGLTVVEVHTVQDALTWLEAHPAGNPAGNPTTGAP